MSNRIRNALDDIKATDELKSNTMDFMENEIARRKKKFFSFKRSAIVVYMFLLIIVGGFCGSYYVFSSPISYISIDINPSIELTLNRFDKVIDVTSYNESGGEVVQNLHLKNKYYTDVIEELLLEEKLQSYINEDSILSFTVISQNEEAILNEIKQCEGYKKYNAQCYGQNEDNMIKAHESGLSFGKYRAYQELLKYDPNFSVDKIKDMTMREIRDIIDEHAGKASSLEDIQEQNGNANQWNENGKKGNGRGYQGGKN